MTDICVGDLFVPIYQDDNGMEKKRVVRVVPSDDTTEAIIVWEYVVSRPSAAAQGVTLIALFNKTQRVEPPKKVVFRKVKLGDKYLGVVSGATHVSTTKDVGNYRWVIID